MAEQAAYKRVLVKISGQSLCAPGGYGIAAQAVMATVAELKAAHGMGVQIALVVGGGNFFRGKALSEAPFIERPTADAMGMLATVINALALQDALESEGVPARVLSAIPTAGVCEPFVRRRAVRHLEKGRVVILAGGTGSPFFTTDTCAALRASELGAEVMMKATKVDGVFEADPVQHPGAKKFERLTYAEMLARQLGVMDLAAVSLCMESRIPMIVFRLGQAGNLAAAARGEHVGTIISSD